MPTPRFEPDDKDRHLVGVLCGMGLTQEQIANCILNKTTKKSIDLKTLRSFVDMAQSNIQLRYRRRC